jgi:hypothetical protein
VTKTLLLCSVVLVSAGCQRQFTDPGEIRQKTIEKVIIADGFGDVDSVRVGQEGFRVGWYFDFTPYDSVRISFSGTRVNPAQSFIHMYVKVGPGCYLRDSISTSRKDFSFLFRGSDLAKPQFAALTFIVPDPGAHLVLSQLSVVGWK